MTNRSPNYRVVTQLAYLLAQTTLLLCLVLGTTVKSFAATSSKPLSVYVNNVENLVDKNEPLCPTDWRALVAYMKKQPQRPDIFIVQQISGQAQADQLAQYMSKQMNTTYKAVVAIATPKHRRSKCGEAKSQQTNKPTNQRYYLS